jgi:hypothetical protein
MGLNQLEMAGTMPYQAEHDKLFADSFLLPYAPVNRSIAV